jgi:NADPH-dependent 2,4-dienoyl-CoA reductase/sulfur reductase-like enzyme/rhodanese-related sulfurtransferase
VNISRGKEKMASKKRILIIGGVAGGASAAARARRLDETAEIILIERGPDVSFANCGLPYYIGGEIADRASLAVQTPQTLKALLNIEVRTRTEALSIDRAAHTVEIQDLMSDHREHLSYDKLILSPGASPLRPPIPGIEHPAIQTLRNLQDMDCIKKAAEACERIAVIGGGFIGLEAAEQFRHLGKAVTLIELQDQVLPQMDPKMTLLIEAELRDNGVELLLGDGIDSFAPAENGEVVCKLKSGRKVAAGMVLLSIGVRPESGLARAAGLELGERGHIRVNEYMQTSDPDIYAAGDAVELFDLLTKTRLAVPLGGPANRQGRIIADHIFLGEERTRPYPGHLGTAIVRVFKGVAGLTGWTEKRLEAAGMNFKTVTVNDNHHAGYYPGATPLTVKICWNPADGRLLGAQATGAEGVDKRLDVFATALAGGLTIDDLCHLELSYAPPFGSAKDIVNIAGFAATNATAGLVQIVDELPRRINGDPNGAFEGQAQVIDVRPGPVAEKFPLPGALCLPLPTLRNNLHRLDPSRPVWTVCTFGKASYFAARILSQNGFQVKGYSGGIRGNLDPRSPAKV